MLPLYVCVCVCVSALVLWRHLKGKICHKSLLPQLQEEFWLCVCLWEPRAQCNVELCVQNSGMFPPIVFRWNFVTLHCYISLPCINCVWRLQRVLCTIRFYVTNNKYKTVILKVSALLLTTHWFTFPGKFRWYIWQKANDASHSYTNVIMWGHYETVLDKLEDGRPPQPWWLV